MSKEGRALANFAVIVELVIFIIIIIIIIIVTYIGSKRTLLNLNFMTPFHGCGLTVKRSHYIVTTRRHLTFYQKAQGHPGTHLIDLEMMKSLVYFGAN